MKAKILFLCTAVSLTILLAGCGKTKTTSGVKDITDLAEEPTAEASMGDIETEEETNDDDDVTVPGMETEGVGYKVYTDDKLGFSINYRTDWSTTVKDEDSASQGVVFKSADELSSVTVTVSNTDEDYTLDDLIDDASTIFSEGNAYTRNSSVTVGDFDGVVMDYILDDVTKGKELLVVDETNNLAYIVVTSTKLTDYEVMEQTFDEMMDSFKLVKFKDGLLDDEITAEDADDIGSLINERINSSNSPDNSDNLDDSETDGSKDAQEYLQEPSAYSEPVAEPEIAAP